MILEAFGRLSEKLAQHGVVDEISLLGGTALVLGFQARQSTKGCRCDLRSGRHRKARGAKGFVSEKAAFRELDGLDLPNLRVQAPAAAYLLAINAKVELAALRASRGTGQTGGPA
ncbi:MAG: hypothetical protein U0Q16_24105 [Bryobacteraceae bacterium]